tara:strand:+ start:364 stop:798 length:435 start_codon:yes stop_codon:yes gene_type:complete
MSSLTQSKNLIDKSFEHVKAANQQGVALRMILNNEFEALKNQDLDRFESYQKKKQEVYDAIIQLTGINEENKEINDPIWDSFKILITECKDLHRRNELLITRKLDAIKGTIISLQGEDPSSSVEVYDRLGKISRTKKGRGFEDA